MSDLQSRLILQSDKASGKTAYDRKKDEAWNTYIETAQTRGEEDTITQFRFFIFVLRCYMGMVKDYVSATKDLVNEINDISEEVNSLVEMDLASTERFTYGIEKYPSFMRSFVMRRRAKRYYRDKLEVNAAMQSSRSKCLSRTSARAFSPGVEARPCTSCASLSSPAVKPGVIA